MRPLDKGTVPLDGLGNPVVVNNYTYWRGQLIDRIGYYCAYCNMPLSHSLQVEHVIPKNPPAGYIPGDALSWDNMLLACGPCNNAKTNNPINFTIYYFPEEHNTLFPFKIRINATNTSQAFVIPTPGLTALQQVKAVATIGLTNLDTIDNRKNIVDIRWKRRRDAVIAVDSMYQMHQDLKATPTFNAGRNAQRVAVIAKGIGFFSLWFERFEDEPEVMQALILGLPGTAVNCFDAANGYRPAHRNPANVADPF